MTAPKGSGQLIERNRTNSDRQQQATGRSQGSSAARRLARRHNALLASVASAAAATAAAAATTAANAMQPFYSPLSTTRTTSAFSESASERLNVNANLNANATTATAATLASRQLSQSNSTLANSGQLLANLFVSQQQQQQQQLNLLAPTTIERLSLETSASAPQLHLVGDSASAHHQHSATQCDPLGLLPSKATQQQQQHSGNCSEEELISKMLNGIFDDSATVNFTSMGIEIWHHKRAGEILLRVACVIPIVLLAVLGNLTIIYSMWKFKPFRTKPTNIFILNMAFADLLTSLVCPGAALFNDIYQFYVLGSFICHLEGFVKITCLLVSSNSLIVLSFDWLWSIVRPFRARISARQSWLVLSGIWMASILLALPFFVWRKLRKRQWKDVLEVWCCDDFTYTRHYWPFVCVVFFYLPTIFMTIVLLVILAQMDKFETKLRLSAQSNNNNNNSINSISSGRQQPTAATTATTTTTTTTASAATNSMAISMKYKRRIVIILFAYLLTSIVCWTPIQFTVIYRFQRYGTIDNLPSWFNDVNFFAQLGASVPAATNPIIFGFMSQPFRRIVSKLLQFKFLDKIMTTNNGKNSGNELRPMDQVQPARNQQQQQPGAMNALAIGRQQRPNSPNNNHLNHHHQQQLKQQQKANSGPKSKLQISTALTVGAAANSSRTSAKQSAAAAEAALVRSGQSPKGASRPPFSPAASYTNNSTTTTNNNNSTNKRVSFNTSTILSGPTTIRQANAASQSASAVRTFVRAIKQQTASASKLSANNNGRAANSQLGGGGGQANAAFEQAADDRESAVDCERNNSTRETESNERLAVRKRSQNNHRRQQLVADCFAQRDQGPSPLSIVSMDSINIEENLEPSRLKVNDDNDDDDNDDNDGQADTQTDPTTTRGHQSTRVDDNNETVEPD